MIAEDKGEPSHACAGISDCGDVTGHPERLCTFTRDRGFHLIPLFLPHKFFSLQKSTDFSDAGAETASVGIANSGTNFDVIVNEVGRRMAGANMHGGEKNDKKNQAVEST